MSSEHSSDLTSPSNTESHYSNNHEGDATSPSSSPDASRTTSQSTSPRTTTSLAEAPLQNFPIIIPIPRAQLEAQGLLRARTDPNASTSSTQSSTMDSRATESPMGLSLQVPSEDSTPHEAHHRPFFRRNVPSNIFSASPVPVPQSQSTQRQPQWLDSGVDRFRMIFRRGPAHTILPLLEARRVLVENRSDTSETIEQATARARLLSVTGRRAPITNDQRLLTEVILARRPMPPSPPPLFYAQCRSMGINPMEFDPWLEVNQDSQGPLEAPIAPNYAWPSRMSVALPNDFVFHMTVTMVHNPPHPPRSEQPGMAPQGMPGQVPPPGAANIRDNDIAFMHWLELQRAEYHRLQREARGAAAGPDPRAEAWRDIVRRFLQEAFNPQQRSTATPASDKAIESLRKLEVPAEGNKKDMGVCSICQDDLFHDEEDSVSHEKTDDDAKTEDGEEDNTVLEMPCPGHHAFHKGCITPWLKNHSNRCPVCRFELQTRSAADETSSANPQTMSPSYVQATVVTPRSSSPDVMGLGENLTGPEPSAIVEDVEDTELINMPSTSPMSTIPTTTLETVESPHDDTSREVQASGTDTQTPSEMPVEPSISIGTSDQESSASPSHTPDEDQQEGDTLFRRPRSQESTAAAEYDTSSINLAAHETNSTMIMDGDTEVLSVPTLQFTLSKDTTLSTMGLNDLEVERIFEGSTERSELE